MKGEYKEDERDRPLTMFHQTPHKFHPHQPLPLPLHHHFQFPPDNSHTSDDTENTPKTHVASTATATATATAAGSGEDATIEVVRRRRGRPPGSKNKSKPPLIVTPENTTTDLSSMTPYVLELPAGVDITRAITSYCRKRNTGLCVLSGSGAVGNVTLRQPSTVPAASVTFHGCFEILSLSATILPDSEPNGFAISLAGPQGRVVGGLVVGSLMAAGTVYVVAASFNNPTYHRLAGEDDVGSSVSGGNENRTEGECGKVAVESSCGMSSGYSCQLPSSSSDVIWAPTARQPPPPPPQPHHPY